MIDCHPPKCLLTTHSAADRGARQLVPSTVKRALTSSTPAVDGDVSWSTTIYRCGVHGGRPQAPAARVASPRRRLMSNNDVGHVLDRDVPWIHLGSLCSSISSLFAPADSCSHVFVCLIFVVTVGRNSAARILSTLHQRSFVSHRPSSRIVSAAAAAAAAVTAGNARGSASSLALMLDCQRL